MITEINIGFAKVQLYEPEMIRIEVIGNVTIGAVEAKAINDQIGILSKGKRCLILMTGSEFTQVDKSCREFSASEEGLKYTIADAFVVKNLSEKLLANFYLKINKPKRPSKIFNQESEAIEWLFSIKEKSKEK